MWQQWVSFLTIRMVLNTWITHTTACYTSRGALAGTRNSSMGPPHEGSHRTMSERSTSELRPAPCIIGFLISSDRYAMHCILRYCIIGFLISSDRYAMHCILCYCIICFLISSDRYAMHCILCYCIIGFLISSDRYAMPCILCYCIICFLISIAWSVCTARAVIY